MGLIRVKSLLVIAVALAVVLLDVTLFGYDFLPDVVGLPILFFCAVLLTDRAGRFARTAAVAAIMLFLEVVRLFDLAGAASVTGIFNLIYMFLTVLLVITAADAVGQFGRFQGHEELARLCDITGHVYALTFVCAIMGIWFEALTRVFWLANLAITVFTLVMFLYFYSAIYVVVNQPFDPPPEIPAGEEEEAEEVGANDVSAV